MAASWTYEIISGQHSGVKTPDQHSIEAYNPSNTFYLRCRNRRQDATL